MILLWINTHKHQFFFDEHPLNDYFDHQGCRVRQRDTVPVSLMPFSSFRGQAAGGEAPSYSKDVGAA